MNAILEKKRTKEELKATWDEVLENKPKLRIRDAAKEIGVSEAELLSIQLGEGTIRLEPNWKEILNKLPELGEIKSIVRNDAMVHERVGTYENMKLMGMKMGLVTGPDIDLRIFLGRWKYAFADTREIHNRMMYSLQFFDEYGTAIQKIYLTNDSKKKVYDEIIESNRSADQSTLLSIDSSPETPNYADKNEVECASFREEWLNLKDTHDFFGMLKKYNLSRISAFEIMDDEYAYQVDPESLEKILYRAAETETPIMVFVGNHGMIQIHTGEVNKIKPMDNWINVLDPKFNLHARKDLVDQAWVVKKPTVDGIVTALELFDKDGNELVQFFGKRKPGIPELTEWQQLIAELK